MVLNVSRDIIGYMPVYSIDVLECGIKDKDFPRIPLSRQHYDTEKHLMRIRQE